LVTRDLDLKSSNDAANKITQKKETLQVIRRILPFRQEIAYSFCFTGAETEIHKKNPLSRYRLPLKLSLLKV
jgi:hypothetical protein